MPGRVNESWFRVERPGTYYGECNQLCGINHAYMPIEIHAVSKEAFQNWLKAAKQKFAGTTRENALQVAAVTTDADAGARASIELRH